MGDGIAKKRKRNGAEPVVDAAALSKKTKKAKKPAPKIEPEEDEDESQEDDDVNEEEDEESAGEGIDGAEDVDNEDDDANDTVADLPTDGAPILPPTAESEMFEQLKLSDKTMKAIEEMGFTKMTPIQKTVRGSNFAPNLFGVDYLLFQQR